MRLTILAAATALAAFAAPALASDFTFVVPLQLHHLPADIRHANVECSVSASTIISGHEAAGAAVGSGHTQVDITGGEYNGDVTVAFNASLYQDPHQAVFWDCGLQQLDTVAPGTATGMAYYPGSAHFIPLSPGAAVTTTISGRLR